MYLEPTETTLRGPVAVIIAAHDAEATIARAARSALNEPEVGEVIVVDDASNDDTAAVARACDDGYGRLSVVKLAKNVGPAGARNAALDRCRAPWIAVLDADDFFLPGRISGLLGSAWNADLVADDLLQVEEGAENAPPMRLIGDSLSRPEKLVLEDFILANLERYGHLRSELGFLKPLFRRAFLASRNLRYKDDLRLGEDYELYARALALGARFLLVPPQGYVSVRRAGSLSDCHGEDDLKRLRDCDRELARIYGITRREQKALALHYENVDSKLQWRRLISALKARDLWGSLRPFVRSWPVTRYLLVNLKKLAKRHARQRAQAIKMALYRW